MLVRNCAGALTFWEDKVFLVKNDRGEWTFPTTIISNDELSSDAALRVLKESAGIAAEIISTAGHINYEISSNNNYQPIYNKIFWYVTISTGQKFSINEEQGYIKGGYFSLEEAMSRITRNYHKSILNLLSKEIIEVTPQLVIA